MANQIIEIDEAYLEGGGQTLRTACALAVATKKPCRVFNIRKNRPKPGLMPQHLLGIQALTQLCNGRLEGDELGSQEIKFYPGDIYRDRVSVSIPTAGSITLVLQALIPPALLAPKPVKIAFDGGATDTFFSPSIDHFKYVFLEILKKMGAKVDVNILRRGYYPEGGAKVEVIIYPTKFALHRASPDAGLKNLNLTERGQVKKITAISGASEFLKGKKVAERQLMGIREILGKLKLPIEEKVEYYDTRCLGSQVCLIAKFENTIIGIDNLGKLDKRAEDVGKEAALELLKEQKSEPCLDKFLSDQILIFLALASGKSQIKVSQTTPHVQTNTWTIQQFLKGEFKIEENIIAWIPK